MECTFWEFGAIVRQEKQRHGAGFVSTVEARRKFDIPEFVTAHSSGVEQPADPQATLVEAVESARAKGWIEHDGRLNDRWYEVVSTLVYGRSLAFLYLSAPGVDETRAMVAAAQGLAFRFVLDSRRRRTRVRRHPPSPVQRGRLHQRWVRHPRPRPSRRRPGLRAARAADSLGLFRPARPVEHPAPRSEVVAPEQVPGPDAVQEAVLAGVAAPAG